MEVILPQLGLFFWTVVLFLIFFAILRVVAWKPIMNALKEREDTITNSLQEAAKAREEMEKLTSDNQALLKEAKAERDKILREATEVKNQIIAEAKQEASKAGEKEREKARQEINAEKRQALAEIKDTAAAIAVEVAEKILRKEFSDKGAQEDFAKQLITELNNN